MLLYLTHYLAQFESGFNVFNYLTMRAILGALTALVLSFVIGPRMIARLSVNQVGQPIREDGPVTHLPKAGTPTMGGVLILTAIAVSTVLWADLENHFVWIVLFVTLSFGAIGYVDDYKKLVLQNPDGISAKQKLFWQSVAALVAAIALYVTAADEISTSLLIPYFKDLTIPLGVFQVVVTYFFIVGFSKITWAFPMWPGPVKFWSSVQRWPAQAWVSCGSTPTPHRYSWGTLERWRWVRRSVSSR